MFSKTFAGNTDLLRHSEGPDLRKLYAEMLGKMRRVFGYFRKEEKSQWSEFSSLLYDTCPLPKNYRTLSLLAHSFHRNTAEQNAWAFNELYSNSLPYHRVSRVLGETLRLIVPKALFGESNE